MPSFTEQPKTLVQIKEKTEHGNFNNKEVIYRLFIKYSIFLNYLTYFTLLTPSIVHYFIRHFNLAENKTISLGIYYLPGHNLIINIVIADCLTRGFKK